MHQLSRRRFTGWVAASSLLLGTSARSLAALKDVETPPVFASLGPAPIQPVAPRAHLFAPNCVQLLDGPFLRAQNASFGYMKRLDIDRLLHVFRVNAGLASNARALGGWEAPTSELRGHFIGHYLSACALGVATTGDPELKRRGAKIVEVFSECQRKLGDDGYLSAFPRFTRKPVFEPLAQQKDTLRGLHANTHIPQVIGAERRFEISGDARFRNVADFFWRAVTQARSYVVGGSSNNEYWLTEPNHLAVEWASGNDHQECCCSYNMLRLASCLFTRDPQVAIVDYYERNLINSRLSTIDLATGRTGYFLSLTPGAWKVTGTEETTFWCCNGTALEDFVTLNRMIYAHDADGIWVNLFVPSRMHWRDGAVRIRQETEFPRRHQTYLLVEASGDQPWTLRLRMPSWLGGAAVVKVNDEIVEGGAASGSYLELTRTWRRGDRVEIELPMKMRWEVFPDRPTVGALVWSSSACTAAAIGRRSSRADARASSKIRRSAACSASGRAAT